LLVVIGLNSNNSQRTSQLQDGTNQVQNQKQISPSLTPPSLKEVTPTPAPQLTSPAPTDTGNTYKNVDGNIVPSPNYYNAAPAGASAKCRDGTYSFSQNRSGTCSHHGGF
jgi:hypothetical protein